MAIQKKTIVENGEIIPTGFATTLEAAEFLGLSRAKVYQLMDAGEIRFAKFGTARRIPWRALYEYTERCMVA